MIYSTIALGMALGVVLYFTRKLYLAVGVLHKEVQMLWYLTKEMGKQQMMEAQAIQDLTEAFLNKKHNKKSTLDKSEPIFKTPQGEA